MTLCQHICIATSQQEAVSHTMVYDEPILAISIIERNYTQQYYLMLDYQSSRFCMNFFSIPVRMLKMRTSIL
jgi:hypothetical protein